MKLSFKNDTSPGGLASMGWKPGATIKADGKPVGFISPPHPMGTHQAHYTVWFCVKSEARFTNKCFKKQFEYQPGSGNAGLNEAKTWIKANWQAIQNTFELHQREP